MSETRGRSLFRSRKVFKPFEYPEYYEAWLTQERMFWLPFEVSMITDLYDFEKKLTDDERKFITHILRFFTQAEVEINKGYMKLMSIFKPIEIQMMLSSFSSMECKHTVAYDFLVSTLNIPEIFYSTFLNYKTTRDKYEYMNKFSTRNKFEMLKSMAFFNGFVEGVMLFSSFVMLMSFSRKGVMKGLGQIITFSMRDEVLHSYWMAKLFRTAVEESKKELGEEKVKELYRYIQEDLTRDTLALEFRFIEDCFKNVVIDTVKEEDLKQYARMLTNNRLIALGAESDKELEQAIKHVPLYIFEIVELSELNNNFANKGTQYAVADSIDIEIK